MKENPIQFYTTQLQEKQAELQQVKKKLSISSLVRVFIFLTVVACIYFGYPSTQIIIGTVVMGLAVFLFLLNRHTDLEYQRDKLKELIAINQLEMDVKSGNLTKLDTGAEFIDPAHEYSHDIDLFGKKSFFQYVNRAVTLAGKKRLATVFTSNSIDKIIQKQDAIKELAKKPLTETIKNTTEIIKRLPELPEIMDKANQALTYFASGQIPQNSNSYLALNEKKSEMITLRNQTAIGLLLLVILGLLVF